MTKRKLYAALAFWLGIAGTAFMASQYLVTHITPAEAKQWFELYAPWVMLGYVAIISLRGLLWMPTMPLILLCAAIAPAWLAFLATFLGTLVSALLVTKAVQQVLIVAPEAKPKRWWRARRWLHRYGAAAIAGWAFFPFVFTEAIVYAASYAGIARKKVVIATCIGEAFLITLLIFIGKAGFAIIERGL